RERSAAPFMVLLLDLGTRSSGTSTVTLYCQSLPIMFSASRPAAPAWLDRPMEDVTVDSGRMTPRRGRPPVSDRQRQRQRLAASRRAGRLFAEQGVAATSGEQIARAAGGSERTLWRCFPSKESCVEPLLTQSIEAFRTVLYAWPP